MGRAKSMDDVAWQDSRAGFYSERLTGSKTRHRNVIDHFEAPSTMF
jgi:hypothetical protein|tara:strand:- start:22229 stop:22366 length:138 start_codon:yes stop_codon:yes gene_type:complete